MGAAKTRARRHAMTPDTPTPTPWRTSSYSGGTAQCVMAAALTDAGAGVRDSKAEPTAAGRTFHIGTWSTFLDQVNRLPTQPEHIDLAAPFRKSSRSGPTNDCVEVAPTLLPGTVVRDS
ncbi:DUF397 domain-containing protein [Embleya sp. AB8]|uniref:DUF397 domain-containing protein n=1 Tax=Embleya sp. AB8 TaxID=3156304 RepID=UPI003C772F36